MVIIEGDCKEVFDALTRKGQPHNWKINPMIRKALSLSNGFDRVLWNWVPREANRLADAAAKLAMEKLCSSDWVCRPPTSIIDVLRADGLPRPP